MKNKVFIKLLIGIITAFLTVPASALTKAGTVISNTAQCFYEDKDGLPLKAISNTIEVQVLPVYNINISPDNQTISAISGENVEIPFLLKNTGNTDDKYILNASNLGNDSADLDNLKIIIDQNKNGQFDTGEPTYNNTSPPSLSMDETLNLLVTGKVPSSITSGQIKIKLDGYSKNDNTKKDTNNTAVIDVNSDGVLSITKTVSNTSPKPDDLIQIDINFKNLGTLALKGVSVLTDFDNDNNPENKTGIIVFDSLPDYLNYVLNSLNCSPNRCIPVFKGVNDTYWKKSESDVIGKIKAVGILLEEKNSVSLSGNESGYLKFSLKVDKKAPNTTVTNTAEAKFKNKSGDKDQKSNPVPIKIQQLIKVIADDTDDNGAYTGSGLSSDPDDLMVIDHASSGVWIEFKNEIWNLGNTNDVVNVELDSSKSKNLPTGYVIKILDDKKKPLVDTNLDGKLDVGQLLPFSKKDIYIQLFVPNGNYSNLILAIKAISSLDSNVYDYTYDKIGKLEAANIKVFSKVRATVSGGNTIKEEPLKKAKILVYEYDKNNKIVRAKKFWTDDDGAIVYDESGNSYALYTWLRDGYSYRMTTYANYQNFPYYLTPVFKKEYFDTVNAVGEEKCWNEEGKEVSCDAKTVKVKIKVSSDNKKLLEIPLDPAGYVYDATTSAKVNGACVTFYKCSNKVCDTYEVVNQDLLDLYPDGITSQENPQVSGPLSINGASVGKTDGSFEFRFKNYKSSFDGWYFIQVTFDCNFPSADPNLKNRYKEIRKRKEVWNPYSGDVYQGELFYINASFPGAILLKIPLISSSIKPIEVKKTASVSTTSVGDYIKWTIKIKNPNATQRFYDLNIYDKLPREFKYKKDSSKLDDSPIANPTVSADGTLKWQITVLNPNEEKVLTFYTITTTALTQGKRENLAYATGWIDTSHSAKIDSNISIAEVNLIRGIFSDRAYIFGKVFIDDNDNRVQDENESGIKGVKIYMEDGRYAITDIEGKYHFDNVIPGTHVLKVDKTTIPKNGKLKIINSRNSGDPDTMFVDVYPGDIFKANFRFVPDEPKVDVSLYPEYQTFKTKYGKVHVERTIESVLEDPTTQKISIITVLKIQIRSSIPRYEINYEEFSPLKPLKNSVYINSSTFENPIYTENSFKWILPLVLPNSDVNLKWNSKIPQEDLKASANLSFKIEPTSKSEKIYVKVPIIFSFVKPQVFKLTVYFDFGKYHLSKDAKESIKNVAKFLRKKDYKKIYITLKSYTDAVRVIGSAIGYERNIELSKKRARAVLDYLRSLLIDTKKVEIR